MNEDRMYSTLWTHFFQRIFFHGIDIPRHPEVTFLKKFYFFWKQLKRLEILRIIRIYPYGIIVPHYKKTGRSKKEFAEKKV